MSTNILGPSINLGLPEDPELLAGIARLTLAQANLDHVLRMTVKTLLGTGTREALDATDGQTSADMRSRIRKLAKLRQVGEAILTRLDSLLNRAARLTRQRNEVVHRPWGRDAGGQPIVSDDGHTWGPAPPAARFNAIAGEFLALAVELNQARLGGGWLCTALDAAPSPPWLRAPAEPAAAAQAPAAPATAAAPVNPAIGVSMAGETNPT